MKQKILGLGQSNKRTQRRVFLGEIERVVPCGELVATITPYMPEGRPPFALEVMLRIHFMQQWFSQSEPSMEEALHDVALFGTLQAWAAGTRGCRMRRPSCVFGACWSSTS